MSEPTREGVAASGRRFLRLARAQNGIGLGPRYYDYPVRGIQPYWCMGCGATIAVGEEHARGTSSSRICATCVEAATDVEFMVPAEEPVARVRVSPETMALLMDGAADEIDGRVSVIAIAWDDSVSSEEAQRLSRAWSSKISEKPVVAATRVRVYGEHRLEAVA